MIRPYTVIENFESDKRKIDISGDFEYSTAQFYSGKRSIRSMKIGDRSSTSFTISINMGADASLSFMYMVNSENLDFFNLYIDGVHVLQKSGAVPWTKFTTILAAGAHKLIFQYVKNPSKFIGLDAFFIDDFIYSIFDIDRPVLLFTDEWTLPYHNPTGTILKNLDFGTLVAGQVSLPQKVIITNYCSFPVTNLQVYIKPPEFPEKMAIEISEYNSPFIPENTIYFNGIIEDGESKTFYVRAITEEDTVAGGDFNIYAKADPI